MTETITTEATALEQINRELSKAKVQKLFRLAIKYGTIIPGFTAIDYLRKAARDHGWESTALVGDKGSGKSNLLLQRGFAIYQDWDKVFRHVVTERDQLMNLLDTQDLIPWIGVDDIGTIFPSSLYNSDRELYTELKSSWETVRTKMSCFDFSMTRKNKVAAFILEDITGDILCFNRTGDIKSHYDYQRWLWLRNIKDPTKEIAKLIRVEEIMFPLIPEAFVLDAEIRSVKYIYGGREWIGEKFYKEKAFLLGVSIEQFRVYWERRLHLTETAYTRFRNLLEKRKQKQVSIIEPNATSEAARALANVRYAKERAIDDAHAQ